MEKVWMTVAAAAGYLGVSVPTIKRGAQSGRWEKRYVHNPKGQAILEVKIEVKLVSADHFSADHQVSADHGSADHFSDDHFSDDHTEEKSGNLAWGAEKVSADHGVSGVERVDAQSSPLRKVGDWKSPLRREDEQSSPLRTAEASSAETDLVLALVPPSLIESHKGIEVVKRSSRVSDGERAEALRREKKSFEQYPLSVRQKALKKYAIVQSYRALKREYKACRTRTVHPKEPDRDKMLDLGELERAHFIYMPLAEADRCFVAKLRAGEVVEAGEFAELLQVNIKTVAKWNLKLKKSGNLEYPVSLCDDKVGKSGRNPKLDWVIVQKIKELSLVHFCQISAGQIYDHLCDYFREHNTGFNYSRSSVEKIVYGERAKNNFGKALAAGKGAYKNKIRAHVRRINNCLPGEKWDGDGKVLDILVKSPFYAHHNPKLRGLVRPLLVVWRDVASDCVVGWCLSLSENPNAVRTALMQGLLRFGAPLECWMDNGTSYKNKAHLAMFRNAEHTPGFFLYDKKSSLQERALAVVSGGSKGLFGDLGIAPHFAYKGNPESKGVESYFSRCVRKIEHSFPVWVGNKVQHRQELLSLNATLLEREYGSIIPSWSDLIAVISESMESWNSQKREHLLTGSGEQMSPLEYYGQMDYEGLPEAQVKAICRDPYRGKVIAQRDGVFVHGILYRHEALASYNGLELGYYYDERKIEELTLCLPDGGIFSQAAVAFIPGKQWGDDMSALAATRRYEKNSKFFYQGHIDTPDKGKRSRTLGYSTEELLFDQSKYQERVKKSGSLGMGVRKIPKQEELPGAEVLAEPSLEELIAAEVERQRGDGEASIVAAESSPPAKEGTDPVRDGDAPAGEEEEEELPEELLVGMRASFG